MLDARDRASLGAVVLSGAAVLGVSGVTVEVGEASRLAAYWESGRVKGSLERSRACGRGTVRDRAHKQHNGSRRTTRAEILVAVRLGAALVVGDLHGQIVPIDEGD